MFKLPQGAQIREVSEVAKPKYKSDPKSIRPEVVDAKVYKLKSAFIKNSVFGDTESMISFARSSVNK